MQEFSARKCWCANNHDQIHPPKILYYCVTPFTHCALPAWWIDTATVPPGCVNRTLRERFVRGVWPVILVWFAFLLTCISCTKAGRQVPDYVLAQIIPGWNEWVLNRILRHDPDRANRLIREHWRRRRVVLERRYLELLIVERERQDAPPTAIAAAGPELDDEDPTGENGGGLELVLRTRIFKRDDERPKTAPRDGNQGESEDSDDNNMCTICFASIDDGDRVGVLPCNHVFHSDCLKLWLARRNTCPLCQMEGVATFRPRPLVQRSTANT